MPKLDTQLRLTNEAGGKIGIASDENLYGAAREVAANMMFGYEVVNPDGHIREPVWMNTDFDPNNT